MVLFAKLHGLLLQVVVGVLRKLVLVPLQALVALVVSILAMLNEEVRRWVGMVAAGLMIWAICWAMLQVAPGPNTSGIAAILGLTWLAAAFKAASLTVQARVWKTRQRQSFRQLSSEVRQVGGQVNTLRSDVVQGIAKRARGSRIERVFPSNREEAARQAARQAAAERAERAARQRAAAEAQRLDDLAAAEPSPYERRPA